MTTTSDLSPHVFIINAEEMFEGQWTKGVASTLEKAIAFAQRLIEEEDMVKRNYVIYRVQLDADTDVEPREVWRHEPRSR